MKRHYILGLGLLLLGLGIAPIWRNRESPSTIVKAPQAAKLASSGLAKPAPRPEYVPPLLVICADEWCSQAPPAPPLALASHFQAEQALSADFAESHTLQIPSQPNILLLAGQESLPMPQRTNAAAAPVNSAPPLEIVEGPVLGGIPPAAHTADTPIPPVANQVSRPAPILAQSQSNPSTSNANTATPGNLKDAGPMKMPGAGIAPPTSANGNQANAKLILNGSQALSQPTLAPIPQGIVAGVPPSSNCCGCGPVFYGGYYSPGVYHRAANGQVICAGPPSACESCCPSKPGWFRNWFHGSKCNECSTCAAPSFQTCDTCQACQPPAPRVSILKRIINWFKGCSECNGLWD